MKQLLAWASATAVAACCCGQEPVQLPSLDVSGTQVNATVAYDSARAVYRYQYTVICPPSNKAALLGIQIDVSGKAPHQQLDADLLNNVVRKETRGVAVQPDTTIPIGITVPDPPRWLAMLNVALALGLGPRGSAISFTPGSTVTGIIIESKFPPALRTATLIPNSDAWDEFASHYPKGTEFTPSTAEAYNSTTTTIAPFEPVDADLYDGGGQQPAEVNKFLRYATPKDNRVKLPAGTTSTYVIVYYGKTIDATTFSATLNGANITSQFHPIPGTAEAIKIPISGTTKLHLEVVGTKSSGATARDSDTITFLPQ